MQRRREEERDREREIFIHLEWDRERDRTECTFHPVLVSNHPAVLLLSLLPSPLNS